MKTTGCFCCFFVRTWFWGVIAGRRFFFTQFLPSCLPIVTRCVIRRRSVPRRRRRELGFFFFKLFFTFFCALRSADGPLIYSRFWFHLRITFGARARVPNGNWNRSDWLLCLPFPIYSSLSLSLSLFRARIFFSLTELYRIFMDFFPTALPDGTGFYRFLTCFWRTLSVFMAFLRVIASFTGWWARFWTALPDFTAFYRVLPSLFPVFFRFLKHLFKGPFKEERSDSFILIFKGISFLSDFAQFR